MPLLEYLNPAKSDLLKGVAALTHPDNYALRGVVENVNPEDIDLQCIESTLYDLGLSRSLLEMVIGG